MIQVVATSLLVFILLAGSMFSALPIYASTDEGNKEPEPEKEIIDEGPEDEHVDKEPEPPVSDQPDTCMGGPPGIDGCPPVEEPEPEPTPGLPAVPDDDCLFHPSLPKCASTDGKCPDGFFQNEDANCVPEHPNGCPEGFHSHEDDETGQCIPNDVACEPGYVLITENKPSCLKKEYACQEYPNAEVCKDPPSTDCPPGFKYREKQDDCHKDITIFIKKIIKDTKVVNKINSLSGDTDIEQTIVAINYDEGKGINCVFGDDNDGQCETFDVNVDKGKEPLLQIIPFT